MEGVIGLQTYVNDTKKSFKSFETKFKKFYKLEYPQEEEPTKASIFAIQAYDAAQAITRAMENLRSSDHELMEKILKSNFKGVSGIMVRFSKNNTNNNGMLISSQSLPNFKIIKVVNQTYKEVAFWTPKLGFVEKFVEVSKNYMRSLSEMRAPESEQSRNRQRKLKFVVPGQGACQEFVNVSYYPNGTIQNITGFSVDVFRAVMNNINYDTSSYWMHPFHHRSYDSMIDAVSQKKYDGAIGDITILARRFNSVDFTVAYLKTDIVMIVTEKQETLKKVWAFMGAFQRPVWIILPTMHIFICFLVWLIEYPNNLDLRSFGNMLWFSVTVIFHVHREQVRNGLARLVLGSWLFALLVATNSFSASLISLTAYSWSQPSVVNVEMLKQMPYAKVGCNAESFIYDYLTTTLEFDKSRVKTMNSIDDYAEALKNRSINAAFFISPHANIFLAKNRKGYTKAVSSFKLGGMGFAFPKGSELATKVSSSIAELTLANNISTMEKNLLDSFTCSSCERDSGPGLGPEPFLALFAICGSIAFFALMYMGLQLWVSSKKDLNFKKEDTPESKINMPLPLP